MKVGSFTKPSTDHSKFAAPLARAVNALVSNLCHVIRLARKEGYSSAFGRLSYCLTLHLYLQTRRRRPFPGLGTEKKNPPILDGDGQPIPWPRNRKELSHLSPLHAAVFLIPSTTNIIRLVLVIIAMSTVIIVTTR